MKSYIEEHGRTELSETLPPSNHYTTPNDVPKAVRDSIKDAYKKGVPIPEIAKIMEIDEQWVELFVAEFGEKTF